MNLFIVSIICHSREVHFDRNLGVISPYCMFLLNAMYLAICPFEICRVLYILFLRISRSITVKRLSRVLDMNIWIAHEHSKVFIVPDK